MKNCFSRFIKNSLVLMAFAFAMSPQLSRADEKPLVVVIPSYNNQDICIKNLDSVFCQRYKNYRVIYIDDASTDGNYEKVKEHIQKCGQEHRVTLMRNEINRGGMANLYQAFWSCQDHEIIIELDGDDEFAHEHVLQRINKEYQDSDVWLTYGHFKDYPSNEVRPMSEYPKAVVAKNLFRLYRWLPLAPRTFYAGLFKRIALQDLMNNGKFFDTAWDLAMMFPMLEMAGKHSRFIDDILYIYHCSRPSNDGRIHGASQAFNAAVVKTRPSYKALDYLARSEVQPYVSAIVLSSNLSLLQNTLRSLHAQGRNFDECIVVCCAPFTKEMADAAMPRQGYPNIVLHTAQQNIAVQLETILEKSSATHVLVCTDGWELSEAMDMHLLARLLQKTRAHGFYLSLSKNVSTTPAARGVSTLPPHSMAEDGIIAWQFGASSFQWRSPYSLSMAMYDKEQLLKLLSKLDAESCSELLILMNQDNIASNAVGLCFDSAKVHKNSV